MVISFQQFELKKVNTIKFSLSVQVLLIEFTQAVIKVNLSSMKCTSGVIYELDFRGPQARDPGTNLFVKLICCDLLFFVILIIIRNRIWSI